MLIFTIIYKFAATYIIYPFSNEKWKLIQLSAEELLSECPCQGLDD